jgi:hypothetical protein
MRIRPHPLAYILLFAPFVGAQSPISYGTPGTQITVLENTLIRVRTDQPLSTKHSKPGTRLPLTSAKT